MIHGMYPFLPTQTPFSSQGQLVSHTLPNTNKRSSHDILQATDTAALQARSPAKISGRNQANTHLFNARVAASTGSQGTAPVWLDAPGDSLTTTSHVNTNCISRVAEASTITQRYSSRGPKRQQLSDSLADSLYLQEPYQKEIATKPLLEMSEHLGSKFTCTKVLIERFPWGKYLDVVKIDETATFWTTGRLGRLPRDIFEDVYAVLVLCYIHLQNPVNPHFEISIKTEDVKYIKTRSELQVLEQSRMALSATITMAGLKYKKRGNLQKLLCLRHWLDAFVDLSKASRFEPANSKFHFWTRLEGLWGDHELRTSQVERSQNVLDNDFHDIQD